MLRKPILAKCSDRSIRAKVNQLSGDPENWFNFENLCSKGHEILTFDFFVNWNNLKVPNEIWIKRVFVGDVVENSVITYEQFYNWISNVDGMSYINRLVNFCKLNNLSCHYFIFKETQSWSKDVKSIYDVCLTEPSIVQLNPSDIQNRIKELRKVAVPIGPNGLIYSTSSLECYLSKTPYFWPGDVDGLLIDQNNNIMAILEYKKHNLDTPIEAQTLMNYRDMDRQKYQSLALLRDKFSSDGSLPIVMVFYPTDSKTRKIKVEKLKGRYDDLRVEKAEIWDLPIKSNPQSQKTYYERIQQFIR